MKSLIIGASAGLGRALAEELASHGHQLFLVASDQRDIDPLISDLSCRYKAKVGGWSVDLKELNPDSLYEKVNLMMGEIDNLFLIAGISYLERDFEQLLLEEIDQIVKVNFLSLMKIVRIFLNDLLQSPHGNCVGMGSVAATRARNRNTLYAASKRGLEFFFSGLRHLTVNTNLKTQFYRVGFLDTQLNFGKETLIPKVSPAYGARIIYKELGNDREMKYLPWWWGFIMFIYKIIPWFVYKKTSKVELKIIKRLETDKRNM